jgi:hypothetical protein
MPRIITNKRLMLLGFKKFGTNHTNNYELDDFRVYWGRNDWWFDYHSSSPIPLKTMAELKALYYEKTGKIL